MICTYQARMDKIKERRLKKKRKKKE